MFSLITSLIPMNQTNVSSAATYLGKFNAEEFETITTINKDLEGNISLEQAMKVAKSVYSDLYYFHDSNFERSNGERYYVINIKDKVENHYTSLTQLFISFDGEICVEGYTSDQKIYVYNGDNILIKIKTLQAYSKILLQEYNLNEEEDDLKTHFSICDFNADGIQDLILSKEEHILSEKQYYTFENGKVIEIEGPSGDEAYPVYGELYSLPSRGTYAFYRGGPASDDNNGNGYMPHTIMEYKLENHKIKLINDLYWVEYQFGDKAGLNEYYLNGTQCTVEDYQNIYNSFSDRIEFYANSEKNRMYWGVNDSGDIGNIEKKTPTKKPDNQPTETSNPNQPTALPTESPTITIGTKTTVGKMKYKVTKVNNNGASEVALIGTTRKKSDKRFTSLKVGNTVKIKGESFKITAIGNNAFRGYKKLKSVMVGKNVKKIGTKAFYGCKQLKKIVIKTKQLQAKKVGNKAFKGIYSKVSIKVPKPKLKSYKKVLRAKGIGKRAKIHT